MASSPTGTRDWAKKGPRLRCVAVLVAESQWSRLAASVAGYWLRVLTKSTKADF